VGLQPKLLNEGEHVIVATRTHVKVLIWPAVILLATFGIAGFAISKISGSSAGTLRIIVIVIAVLILAVFVLVPFLKWLSTTYAFTNRRLITRSGVLSRRGHDIPVHRISDVAFERGLMDRILGCGTLIISDASETGQVQLHDIPRVESVQLTIQQELVHPSDKTDDGA